jgi:teichuronic acid biosynthesis glycosyltransferase TuaC
MRVLGVTNIYPTPENPAAGIFIEQQVQGLLRSGVEMELMYLDRLRKGMSVYLGLGHRVSARIREVSPDIVHVMYGGVMADLATKAVLDRPVVVTFHGSDLLGEPLSRLSRRIFSGYGIHASRRAARRADGIIVVSRRLMKALPKDIVPSRIRIIPCGIDLERFAPLDRRACIDQLGWDPRRFHILFASNSDNPIKRPGLAFAAVEALKNRGVPAELHILRGVSNDRVPVWLNASSTILLTSKQEGSPTIVKEALACNVAVVSTDVGDVSEYIHAISGCHIADPDPNDLSAKLLLVFEGPARILGREHMQDISLQRIAGRLKELYFEIASGFPISQKRTFGSFLSRRMQGKVVNPKRSFLVSDGYVPPNHLWKRELS